MYRYRLSTGYPHVADDRAKLVSDIQELLALPSNYRIIEGGKIKYIYSGKIVRETKSKGVILVDENGQNFKTFDSGNHCALYLNIGRTSVYSKIKSNQPVYVDNKLYFIK